MVKDFLKHEMGFRKWGIPIVMGVGAIAAYKLGCSYTEFCISRANMAYHNLGYIKFFDPKKGVEIGIEEVVKVIGERDCKDIKEWLKDK